MGDAPQRALAREPSEALWRQLAEKAAGAGLETLASRSAEGVEIAPLHQRRRDDPPQPWRPAAAWAVAQRADHPDPDQANALARLDLEAGADALVLVDAASPFARGFGLDLASDGLAGGDLDRLLADIELDRIGLRLDAGPRTAACLAAIGDLVSRRRLGSAHLAVDVGFDPIGCRARLGKWPQNTPQETRPLLDLREKAGLAGPLFLADGRPYHEAGAGEAQELAAVLATAVAYLRQGEQLGLSLDDARKNVALLLAADAEVFLGLAKFRAMRRLWAQVETACELAPWPVRLHAETSWRMMTRRDPWTNVMRATAATFAAALGGADSITVLPFTLPLGLPDAAARRLARNVQRVLLDEAHLGQVADPAAGAGSFEALTDALAAKAWALFQEIEREGGIERSLADGHLQARIAEVAAQRAGAIATRARGIVGTSTYASLTAPGVTVLEVRANPEPDTAFPVLRDAAPFEALRDTAEGITTMRGRPRVFLATLGAPAAFGPRATWATSFFAAAVLSAEAGLEERDTAELVEAFAAEDTALACLCGADAAYAEAPALAAALRKAGARRVLLVGPPGAYEGIDTVLHENCDALRILADLLDVAGEL